MVYHYSPAGTVDRTPRGPAYVNDWVPVLRQAAPAEWAWPTGSARARDPVAVLVRVRVLGAETPLRASGPAGPGRAAFRVR